MSKDLLYFADLTHTSQGISAPTFPLGISFVASYAKQALAQTYDLSLFKFPDELGQALQNAMPRMLCMSNYSWNSELAYCISSLAKQRNPNLIVVFGGPNFPITAEDKIHFFEMRPAIDFYIELEGELGLVDLVRKLEKYDFDIDQMKNHGERALNTSYLHEGNLTSGDIERITDITRIPSPYLTGILDQFFDLPLAPMIETTRGCPFSCTYCSDGIKVKSAVRRFDATRTSEELRYIAEHIRHSDELIITDLNFGMYKEDLQTAKSVADLQDVYEWPVLVKASAGKNKPERVIEAATILDGSWMIGSAIQSTDPDVLKAIQRDNIATDVFTRFIKYSNSLNNDAITYTEVILALPGDTRAKHFKSIEYGVLHQVNTVRMYQAMLLTGTEMATPQCRERFGLQSRFRTIPGCVGIYNLFGADTPVAEIEEIIVGSKIMSFQDYIDCRVMNLMIETFYNNALFEEVFAMLRGMDVPVFDIIVDLTTHDEFHSTRIREIVDSFVDQTGNDLFGTREAARKRVLIPRIAKSYIAGEFGINELLVHQALLYKELPDIADLLFRSVKTVLDQRGQLTLAVEHYLEELQRLIIHRKRDITQTDQDTQNDFSYDFASIYKRDCRVDPNALTRCAQVTYRFFHDDQQKIHIGRQKALYADTPIGLGRLMQRSNLKKMYRHFRTV